MQSQENKQTYSAECFPFVKRSGTSKNRGRPFSYCTNDVRRAPIDSIGQHLPHLAMAENPSYSEPVTGEGTLIIHAKSLEDKSISLSLNPKEVNYDRKEHEVTYSVYDSERETALIEGVDYEIVQSSSTLKGTEPGTYKVIISADDKTSEETAKSVTGTNYIGMRSAVWEIIDTSIHMYRIDFPRDLCDRCSLPATGITSTATAAFSDQVYDISYSKSGLSVQIPSLSIEAEIVTVPFSGNEWPVSGLGNKAGLLEGSALPGQGYSIIAAHNTLSQYEVGPFGALATMKENDKIFVNGPRGKNLNYSVYANELIEPNDFDTIATIAEEEPGYLILITCENESQDGTYLNRRVVFAKPM